MTKLDALSSKVERVYAKKSKDLLFHGLHHINFVRKKAAVFAKSNGADVFITESAALLHDLNYIVKKNSEPEDGARARKKLLISCRYSTAEIVRIEQIIMESHTATRNKRISREGQALSDADTLFKSLPITPILFASKYLQENDIDIRKLAHKVTSEQNRLMKQGIYFYTPLAKRQYLRWAKVNLALWNNVQEALEDEDIAEVISLAKRLGAL